MTSNPIEFFESFNFDNPEGYTFNNCFNMDVADKIGQSFNFKGREPHSGNFPSGNSGSRIVNGNDRRMSPGDFVNIRRAGGGANTGIQSQNGPLVHGQNRRPAYRPQEAPEEYGYTPQDDKGYHYAPRPTQAQEHLPPTLSNSDLIRNTCSDCSQRHYLHSPRHAPSPQYESLEYANGTMTTFPASCYREGSLQGRFGAADREGPQSHEEEESYHQLNHYNDHDEVPALATQHQSQGWRQEPNECAQSPFYPNHGRSEPVTLHKTPIPRQTTAKMGHKYEEAKRKHLWEQRPPKSRVFRRNDGMPVPSSYGVVDELVSK
ncbi:hypothetical protein PQX77_006834 [Marasmius sp. AFHP31]|nr:hypothetical protein PQX77_006834 [Marasmius sp. AFHP31]